MICSAEEPIDHIFATGDEEISDQDKHFARTLIGDLSIAKVSSWDILKCIPAVSSSLPVISS